MVLPDKKETLEVKQQVMELFQIGKQFNEDRKEYEARRNALSVAIKNYMYCNKGIGNKFQFRVKSKQNGNRMVTVKKIEPSTVSWDAAKLEEVLDKDARRTVISKTYTINDMEGLVDYLKSCGVNPKRFKAFIEVERQVDNMALEQLSSLGKIDADALKGCYTVNKGSSYLRIGIAEDNE